MDFRVKGLGTWGWTAQRLNQAVGSLQNPSGICGCSRLCHPLNQGTKRGTLIRFTALQSLSLISFRLRRLLLCVLRFSRSRRRPSPGTPKPLESLNKPTAPNHTPGLKEIHPKLPARDPPQARTQSSFVLNLSPFLNHKIRVPNNPWRRI